MKRTHYFLNVKNQELLFDRNTIHDFTLEFFKEVLIKSEVPLTIALKFRLEGGEYRTATKFYIIVPQNLNKENLVDSPSFINFMTLVKLFLNTTKNNYDDLNIDSIFYEYLELKTNKNLLEESKIYKFNHEVLALANLVPEVSVDTSNVHKFRKDDYPANMDFETWFSEDNSLTYVQWLSDSNAILNKDGIDYIFSIEENKYTCSILYPYINKSNDRTIIRFTDELITGYHYNGGSLDSFIRKYIKKDPKTGNDLVERTYVYENGDLIGQAMNKFNKKFEGISTQSSDNKPQSTSALASIGGPKRLLTNNKDKRFYSTSVAPASVMTEESKDIELKNKIIALDLETRSIINNKSEKELQVISGSWSNGTINKSFYITDYENDKALLKDMILSLLIPQLNKATVYVHNLSGFDSVFFLKTIVNLEKKINSIYYSVDILKREDKIISITIKGPIYSPEDYDLYNISLAHKLKNDFCEITFYDSYSILPVSLNKLAKSFTNTDENNTMNSKLVWDTKLHDIADLNDPEFKNRLLEYNMHDCLILHDVIYKFYLECRKEFEINILKSPTLPGIAFKLFITKFLNKDHNIPITWEEEFVKLRPGYHGGAVDVYRPHGYNLNYYDVNSLYPFVMKEFEYPIGQHEYFEFQKPVPLNSINNYLGSLFGIVGAVITAPDIKCPILLHHENKKVIAPTGTWEGIYCTEELKNAMKYGYKVDILWGYTWPNKAKIFTSYVDTLYTNRLKYPKSDPRNFISKLMLNSLYGRFGLSPYLTNQQILDKEELIELYPEDLHEAKYLDLGELVLLETSETRNRYSDYYKNNQTINLDTLSNKVKKDEEQEAYEIVYGPKVYKKRPVLNISLPIAMFVTAYARIYKSEFKMKYANNLYYSDTDSFVFDIELPEHLVSDTKLGLFKLEHRITEGVFIAPKVYSFINDKGEYICKIKGAKNKLDLDSMKSLLLKDSDYSIAQSKWYRSIESENIVIKDQLYKLRATDNKRHFIYDSNDHWVDTKPINLG